MLFDTVRYWIFFAVVLVLVRVLPRRSGHVLLIVASYAFYSAWDMRFAFLLAGSTAVNFFLGLAIQRAEGLTRRRWLIAAVTVNLVVLGFFKYFNFFVGSFAALFGLDPAGAVLNIVLPVGVSFFTFESIAYCADVHRRDLRASASLLDFALFIAFFPHLVAGPIIRPRDFLPQLASKAPLDEAAVRWGLVQIVKGLVKKMVLADALAPLANAVFAPVPAVTAPPGWVGVLAFSLQIYCDFAGYTDIARGCARLLGFSFPPNFERPYLAQNITEFWRSWHISLSTWLRDYLYIPLGGNRKGEGRTYVNLMIVMGLGGLWHGASWNFAIWGLLHGAMLAVHRRFGKSVDAARGWLAAAIGIVTTFVLASLAWIPFRAPDHATAWRVFVSLPDGIGWESIESWRGILFVLFGLMLLCALDRRRRLQTWLIERAPTWVVGTACGVSLWVLALFAKLDQQLPFIYFQF